MITAWQESCPDECPDCFGAGADKHHGIMGGIIVEQTWWDVLMALYTGMRYRTKPVTWREYLGDYKPHMWPRLTAIRRACKKQYLIGKGGFDAQVDDTHWRCSDGHTVGFTHRGWGDFQAAIHEREDYRTWAWTTPDR